MALSDRLTALLDTVEVYDAAGDLDGYALAERRAGRPLTPVRCCRTCAWSDLAGLDWRAGAGLVYAAPPAGATA